MVVTHHLMTGEALLSMKPVTSVMIVVTGLPFCYQTILLTANHTNCSETNTLITVKASAMKLLWLKFAFLKNL